MLIDDIKNATHTLLEPSLTTLHSYRIVKREVDQGHTELAVTCQIDERTRAKILTVAVLDEDKQIQIPTIYLPGSLRGRKIGFRVLQEIFKLGMQHGYDTFIVDMVPGFHRKMLSRGAYEIDSETVQINPNTRLT